MSDGMPFATETEEQSAMRNALADEAERLGWPTTGPFAERLWRLSNNPSYPIPNAILLMRSCGYVPFSGYPLVRGPRT